jgi:hypothetical protein
MGNEVRMTLWKRTASGIGLCAGVAGTWGAAELLSASGLPALQGVGGILAVLAYSFGGVFFALGALIILGGIVLHLRDALQRRSDA